LARDREPLLAIAVSPIKHHPNTASLPVRVINQVATAGAVPLNCAYEFAVDQGPFSHGQGRVPWRSICAAHAP
jgi:hypothetical protein